MFNKVFIIKVFGTNIVINVLITINGPNGIYSSVFFILVISKMMLKIAPIKNEISDIIIILLNPKYNPSAPHKFYITKSHCFFSICK